MKKLPILLLLGVLIAQPSRLWLEDREFFNHLNGSQGFTNEWAWWLIFAHYGQFFVYMAITKLLLIRLKNHLKHEELLFYKISNYCLNIFISIAMLGFCGYLYYGWPEDSTIYIIGTVVGFLITIITEQWKVQK